MINQKSITDSLGEECATCNFPCQLEFYECSGLPTGKTTTTFAPTPSTTQQFCPEDVFECPDGSYLSRDPERGCEFGECSTDESSVICPADVFECPDGSYLSRDPERGCEFFGECSTDESVTAAPTTTATTLLPSASSQPTIGATTVGTSTNPVGDFGTNMTLAPVTTTVGVESTTIAHKSSLYKCSQYKRSLYYDGKTYGFLFEWRLPHTSAKRKVRRLIRSYQPFASTRLTSYFFGFEVCIIDFNDVLSTVRTALFVLKAHML